MITKVCARFDTWLRLRRRNLDLQMVLLSDRLLRLQGCNNLLPRNNISRSITHATSVQTSTCTTCWIYRTALRAPDRYFGTFTCHDLEPRSPPFNAPNAATACPQRAHQRVSRIPTDTYSNRSHCSKRRMCDYGLSGTRRRELLLRPLS